jgi:hypothetical protein
MTMCRSIAGLMRSTLRSAAAATLLVILVASPSSSASRAEEGSDPAPASAEIPETATFEREGILKAAFVLNFARYTSWPPPGPGNRYHICIIGQDSVGDAMRLLDGKPLKGKTVVVSPATGDPTGSSCQMLYVSKSAADEMDGILAAAEGKPILTVSDLPGFVHAGGMIGLKIVDNRVRFDINARIARKVGLQLSAQLLRLADMVVDGRGEGG